MRTTAVLLIAALGAIAGHQRALQSQLIGAPTPAPGLDKPVRVISGRFTSDIRLTNEAYWVPRGAVFIAEPARIFIDAGTRIVGESATRGTLVIERGAQIVAEGTAAAPIVFTSDQPVGSRGRADWGGLIINGRAPVNLPGGVGLGEGDTGIYGGDDPHGNFGILRYVRVEFAGIEFSPDNELNGIAFQGVGRGTTVDAVQVSFNKDDGIEMFGGTVDVKHVVLTSIGDDSMDWTFGWQGQAQFVIAQQRGDDADRGIEADNNGNNNDLLPRSKPTIYNITLIGDPDRNEGAETPTASASVKARPASCATSSSPASRPRDSTCATTRRSPRWPAATSPPVTASSSATGPTSRAAPLRLCRPRAAASPRPTRS